ncbi:MAG: transposase [Candidatus Helarchaeota archaeon]
MLVSDTIRKWNLVGFLGVGENADEIKKLLLILKKKLPFIPKLICVDFAPAWIEAITEIFPECEIQICCFHVMQLLNRALLKDLNRYKKTVFDQVINEARQLRKELLMKEKEGIPILIAPTNPALQVIHSNFMTLGEILREDDPKKFIASFHELFNVLKDDITLLTQQLIEDLLARIPRGGVTKKNLKYYKKEVYKAFRKNVRLLRVKFEKDKKEFSRSRFSLLTRPEKLSPSDKDELESFLQKYPKFRKFRVLSLKMSDILRLPPQDVSIDLILTLSIWDDASKELQAAMTTIKKRAREIIAYSKHLADEEDLSRLKRIRVNAEPEMRKVKKSVRSHFGFRTEKTTQFYLESQLQCPVVINI